MSGNITRLAPASLLALLLIAASASAVPPAGIQYVPAAPGAGGSLLLTAPPVPRPDYLPVGVERTLSEPGPFTPRDSWTLRIVGSSAALGAPPVSPARPVTAAPPPRAAYESRDLAAALGGSGGLRLLTLFAAVAAVLALSAWRGAGRSRTGPSRTVG